MRLSSVIIGVFLGILLGYIYTVVFPKTITLVNDRVEYKYDTVYIPKVHKEVVVQTTIDTFFLVDTLLRIDTVKIIEKCKEVVTDYYTKREYLDTIMIPNGKIYLNNLVYTNKIINFGYRYDITQSTGGLYAGGMVGEKSLTSVIAYQRGKVIYQGMIGTDGIKLGLIYKIE
jgi:hypothetical protein